MAHSPQVADYQVLQGTEALMDSRHKGNFSKKHRLLKTPSTK